MPTDHGHEHYLASKRGETDTGMIKLMSGEDMCGDVRKSVGLPDRLLVASSADISATKLLERFAAW